MTKKIGRAIRLVAFLVLFSSIALIVGVLYNYFSKIQLSQLRQQTQMAANGIDLSGVEYLKNLDTDEYRITLMEPTGNILYDSHYDESSMENHLEREEIKDALKKGEGQSIRYSKTLMQSYLYYAKRLDNGMVIRLSFSQSTVFRLLYEVIWPMLLIAVLTLVLSMALASRLSRSIVKPLNELNLDEPLENSAYDELSVLLRRIDSQQKQLKEQENELVRKNDELDAIIGNMNEGLILLNSKLHIVSINQSAVSILGMRKVDIGADILTVCRDLSLQKILAQSQKGIRVEKNIEFNESIYQISAEPILYNDDVKGIAVLLFDVTQKEKAEAIRREFTANVSHELKTPLHSIAGYAELMAGNMVKEEDYAKFSERIYSEAQRMVSLVEDIIKLSWLDEGASDVNKELIDVYAVAKNVVDSLNAYAAKKNIQFVLSGEQSLLCGIRQLIEAIIYNICDNAVNYNRENGTVTVAVKNFDDEVVISVKDTGIGIPLKERDRIFERFYRVDKSRSKEVGGTGLGLSIVKHAVLVHKGKIEVDSVQDEGTTMTVTLPKN